VLPLFLLPATAALIAQNEIVPKDVPGRILFFDRKAAAEMAAYKRATTFRLTAAAAQHLRRYRVFRDEAIRLRAHQIKFRSAVQTVALPPVQGQPFVPVLPPLPETAALIAKHEVVPHDLPSRVRFFDSKAAAETAAHKKAVAFRLTAAAARHLRRHKIFLVEASRQRAHMIKYSPATRPVQGKSFVPAGTLPPPPAPAPLFQALPQSQFTEVPTTMEPSTAKQVSTANAVATSAPLPSTVAAEAAAAEAASTAASVEAASTEPASGGLPWGKIGLAALGGFVVYKVVTRKKAA
jgi:hypothetical protein